MDSPFVEHLTAQDVLLGRGKKVDRWEGNVRFRKLVGERSLKYYVCDNTTLRDEMARELLLQIVRDNGRFLREVGPGIGDFNRQWTWKEIAFPDALKKVKQALRDAGAKANLDAGGEVLTKKRRSPKKPKTTLLSIAEPTQALEPIPFEQLSSMDPLPLLNPAFTDVRIGLSEGVNGKESELAEHPRTNFAFVPESVLSTVETGGSHSCETPFTRYLPQQAVLGAIGAWRRSDGQYNGTANPQLMTLPSSLQMEIETALSLGAGAGAGSLRMDQRPRQLPPLSGDQSLLDIGLLRYPRQFSHPASLAFISTASQRCSLPGAGKLMEQAADFSRVSLQSESEHVSYCDMLKDSCQR